MPRSAFDFPLAHGVQLDQAVDDFDEVNAFTSNAEIATDVGQRRRAEAVERCVFRKYTSRAECSTP